VVAGLMWFSYGQKEFALRHSCEHDDRLSRYGWLHHDGVMYGEQEIVDHGQYKCVVYVCLFVCLFDCMCVLVYIS